MAMFENYPDVVTVEQLVEMLNIGRNSAYELIRAGIIPSVRIGRNIRISKAEIIKYLSSQSDRNKPP